MPEPAAPHRRRWFQLHLTTCIVLMFAAAALLSLNTRTRWVSLNRTVCDPGSVAYMVGVEFLWGWPLIMNREHRYTPVPLVADIPAEVLDDMIERQDCSDFPADAEVLKELTARPVPFSGKWIPPRIAANALTALAILLITACVVETTLRKLRRPPSPSKGEG